MRRWSGVLHDFLSRPVSERSVDPAIAARPNTTQISVMDAGGLVVSLTTSAGEGTGFIVPGTGVILNNMLGEADLHPQGFHQSTPGKRIPSMMAPTVVLENSQPVLALGSGGANRIRSAILQVLLNTLAFDLPLSEAVESAAHPLRGWPAAGGGGQRSANHRPVGGSPAMPSIAGSNVTCTSAACMQSVEQSGTRWWPSATRAAGGRRH